MKDSNIVTLNIDQKLQDFLIKLFGFDEERKAIPINRRHEIGQFIVSQYTISHQPINRKFDNPCRLILPSHEDSQYIIESNFVYFSSHAEMQINNFIEAIFKRYVHDFISVGANRGYKKTVIYDALLMNLNMKKNVVTYDMIKKMDYRHRKKFTLQISQEIQDAIVE